MFRSMVSPGDQAPSFRLPGVTDRASSMYDLDRTTGRGRAVVLVFYPFDFSPACTRELCALRDAAFLSLADGAALWAVSGDSIYAHWAFADRYGIDFPLLSDSDGSVAAEFDVCYDEFEGHRRVPKRAVVVVDPDRTVRYRWVTDDAYDQPDLQPVLDAVRDLDVVDDQQIDRASFTHLVDDHDGPGNLDPTTGEEQDE